MNPQRHRPARSRPISPWLVAGMIGVCALAAYLLLPSHRTLLERQVRDGAHRRALETLQQIPAGERKSDEKFFALLEIQLERKVLVTGQSAAAARLLAKACAGAERFAFDRAFLDEVLELVPLAGGTEAGLSTLRPFLNRVPGEARRTLVTRAGSAVLAAGQPRAAAELFLDFWRGGAQSQADAEELARLWRLAGEPRRALEAIETGAAPETVGRLRIALLRETGEPLRAYQVARVLWQAAPVRDRELFEVLVLTAGQANRTAEVLGDIEAFAAARPNDAEVLRIAAEMAMGSGETARAIPFYERLVQLEPANGTNVLKLGQLNEWNSRPEEGFEHYLKALELRNSDAVGRLLALNPGLYRDVQLVEALKQAESWLPRTVFGVERARLEAPAGHFEEARRLFENLRVSQPDDFDLHLEFGRLLLDLYDYTAAKQVYGRAVALRTDDLGAIKGLAEAHFHLGEYEQAFVLYRRGALELRSDETLENYINVAESLGKLDEVIRGLDQRMQRATNALARDYDLLAFVYNQKGDANQVLATLKRGLEKLPDDDGLRLQATYALADRQDFLQAAAMLAPHRELRSQRELARLYVSLLVQGQAHLEADRFLNSGVADAILLWPGLMEVRAQILEALDQNAAAAELYARLHTGDPATPRHALNHARLLAMLGRLKEAEAILRPLLEGRLSAETLKLAAQVLAAAGKYRDAEKYQRLYLETQPSERPQALGFLGDILLSRGDKPNARRVFLHAIAEMEREAGRTTAAPR